MHEPFLSALLRKLAAEPETNPIDLWPGVRERLAGRRPDRPASICRSEGSQECQTSGNRRLGRRRLPRLVAAAATAIAIAVLSVSTLQPWSRPSSANAEETFQSIRTEAFYDSDPEEAITTTEACPPTRFGGNLTPGPIASGAALGSAHRAPGDTFGVAGGGSLTPGPLVFGMQQGPPGAPRPEGGEHIMGFTTGPGPDGQQSSIGVAGPDGVLPPGGPGSPSTTVRMPNPTVLSDRLGQALGISGDRVREAMRQMIGTVGPPVDPLSAIASQLGMSVDKVRDAFSDPACPGRIVINSNDVGGPAQKLGVSPDRLAAAIAATAPPPPPAFDEMIRRYAQSLGVSSDRLRAALEQVEGPNRLHLAVPGPAGAPPSSPVPPR